MPAELVPNSSLPDPVSSPLAPTIVPVTPTPECTNKLTFVADVTIPDGTTVTAGQPIDKQWLVSNSGTCDWDARYRLKWIGGDVLGAPTEQALFPARAGTLVTLRIVFKAPQAVGSFLSVWQAFASDGSAFKDTIDLQVIVQ